VNACPLHGVRLRERKCGAPAAEHLATTRRPRLPAICATCGRIGHGCRSDLTEASLAELWVARQAAALLALGCVALTEATLQRLRSGISETVNAVYGGRPVTAAKHAGLARACVFQWLQEHGAPSFGMLFKFALAAQADVSSMLLGRYRPASREFETDEPGSLIPSLDRPYRHLDWVAIRDSLSSATASTSVTSVEAVAQALKVDRSQLRRVMPGETSALAIRADAARAANREASFETAFNAYSAAAAKAQAAGIIPTRKGLQLATGLLLFHGGNRNFARSRALDVVLRSFLIPRPTQRSSDH
jgi:hypothetical protein